MNEKLNKYTASKIEWAQCDLKAQQSAWHPPLFNPIEARAFADAFVRINNDDSNGFTGITAPVIDPINHTHPPTHTQKFEAYSPKDA